jgi:hypothetical protein
MWWALGAAKGQATHVVTWHECLWAVSCDPLTQAAMMWCVVHEAGYPRVHPCVHGFCASAVRTPTARRLYNALLQGWRFASWRLALTASTVLSGSGLLPHSVFQCRRTLRWVELPIFPHRLHELIAPGRAQ